MYLNLPIYSYHMVWAHMASVIADGNNVCFNHVSRSTVWGKAEGLKADCFTAPVWKQTASQPQCESRLFHSPSMKADCFTAPVWKPLDRQWGINHDL